MKKKSRKLLSLTLAVLMVMSLLPMAAHAANGPYTISFNSNGGSGTMDDMIVNSSSQSFTTPECTFTPPEGKEFACWTSESHGLLTIGQGRYTSHDLVITARWRSTSVTHTLSVNGVEEQIKEGDLVKFSKPKDDDVPAGKWFADFNINPAAPEELLDIDGYYDGWLLMPAGDLTIDYVLEDQTDYTLDFTHSYPSPYGNNNVLPDGFWKSLNAAESQGLITCISNGSTATFDINGDSVVDYRFEAYSPDEYFCPAVTEFDSYTVSGIQNAPYKSITFQYRDNTEHSITITDGKVFDYTDGVLGAQLTSAKGGTPLKVLPDKLEGKYVVGWTTNVPGIGPFDNPNYYYNTIPDFGMPAEDLVITPIYSQEVSLSLISNEAFYPDDVLFDDFRRIYLTDMSSWSSGTDYPIDLNGDGSDDISIRETTFSSSYGSGTLIKKCPTCSITDAEYAVDPGSRNPLRYYPITLVFSASPLKVTLDIRCSNGATGKVAYRWNSDAAFTTGDWTENGTLELTRPDPAKHLIVKAAPADGYFINQSQTEDGTGTYTDKAELAAALLSEGGASFIVKDDGKTITIEFDNQNGAGTAYPVWVGGVQITDDNKGDVLNDGTVIFTPATGSDPAKLTLKNANISGATNSNQPNDKIGIYSKIDLTLEILEANTITATDAQTIMGILMDSCALSIVGDGTLSVTAGDGSYSCAINTDKMTICSGTIKAVAGKASNESEAVYSNDFIMEDGTLIAESGESSKSWGINGSATIKGGSVTAIGQIRAFNSIPNLDDYADPGVTVNTEPSETGAKPWNGTDALGGNESSLKYVKIEPASNPSPLKVTLDIRCSNGATGKVEYRWNSDSAFTTSEWTENGTLELTRPDAAKRLIVKAAPADGYFINQSQTEDSTGTYTDKAELAAALLSEGGASFIVKDDGKTITIEFDNQNGGGGGGGLITLYSLTYETNGGSAIAATTHFSGEIVKLTAKPTRLGYTFTGWYSDAGLKYQISFIRMDSDKTVYAGWKKSKSPFTDVPDNAWYKEAVDYVVDKGLMAGTSADKFSPDLITSRAMIVTILYRLEGRPAVYGTSPFNDVAANTWYTKAVAWAAANGIVMGYGNGKFGPDDLITREQFAAMLYRYANFKGYDTSKAASLSGYTDAANISGYAVPAMKWAKAEKLITGRTKTTLVPQGKATRAEAAAILMRFIENVK